MMECTVTHGPCSWKAPPEPPPCPLPPKIPFPWKYPAALIALLTAIGLLYQYYLYTLKRKVSTVKEWRERGQEKSPFYADDLPECVQYLIIGAGPAGWSAFKRIRKEDPKSLVFFVTEEDTMPYKRYPMSRWMWWRNNPPDLEKLDYIVNGSSHTMYETKCENFMDVFKFAKKETGPGQAIALGWEIAYLDPDEHVIWIKTVVGERPMYYERCLIATGSKPKTLPMLRTASRKVREHVTTFRNLRDLEKAYERVTKAKHVTIIGGGLLGVELAWFISRMHKEWVIKPPPDYEPVKITLLSKCNGVLSNILPSYLAEYCAERLRCCNINVVKNRQVYDVYESDEGKVQLTLSDGSNMVTDFAFVCIGTTPRDEMAPPSNLERDSINGGFLANTELQVRKHLYTAGDVASIYSQWKDTRIRFDHLENAIETGSIAGANMTGLWERCNIEPYFTLNLSPTINIEAIGEIGGCMPTIGIFIPCEGKDTSDIQHLTEMEQAEKCNQKDHEYMNRYKHGIVFYFREQTVVGIVLWNITTRIDDRKDVAVEFLRARPTYEDINLLAEQLGVFNETCSVAIDRAKIILEGCPKVNVEKFKNLLKHEMLLADPSKKQVEEPIKNEEEEPDKNEEEEPDKNEEEPDKNEEEPDKNEEKLKTQSEAKK